MSDAADASRAPRSLRPFYADWAGYNRRTIDGLRRLTPEDLALRVASTRDAGEAHWPIWAVAGHTAGTRVYWLCHVFGEPGAATTPFLDPTGLGWEDDLSQPRSADELASAYEATWAVIEGCLRRWTPDTIGETARRRRASGPDEVHTRQSILLRLINHEAYHVGEINLALGANGREPINLWPGRAWEERVQASIREG